MGKRARHLRILRVEVSVHPEGTELEAKEMARVMKDYEGIIEHHPGRVNMVADILSRKFSGSVPHFRGRCLP